MAETAEQLVVLLEAKVNDFEKNMRRAARSANDNFGGIEDRGRRMGRNLERDLASSTARINTTLNGMGKGVGSNLAAIGSRASAALGAALSANELKKYADTWTETANKISAAGEALELVGARQSELADLAIRSRSDFGAVVELYTGLKRSTEALGTSQAQVLSVVETVSKGFAVNGTSAEDAANSIRQLKQSFDLGRLGGEELNSVLEGAPPIARLIAAEFGVTTGALKKLAEEGKLSSDKVFTAILKGRTSIEAEFAKTNATIAQSSKNLSTALTRYIGQADQATGASRAVAGGIQAIADNMNVAAPAAAVLAATLLGAFAGGPIGAGIAGTTAALALFGDSITPIAGDLATLGDYARAAFTILQDGAAELAPQVQAAFQRAAELATTALSTIGDGDALPRLLEAVKATLNAVIGAFTAAAETIRVSWVSLGPVLVETIGNAMNAVVATVQAAVNKVVGAINSITGAVNAAGGKIGIDVGLGTIPEVNLGQIANRYEGAGKAAAEGYGRAFKALTFDYVGATIDAGAKGLEALRNKANLAAAGRIMNAPIAGKLDNGSLDARLKAPKGAADGKGGAGGAEKEDAFEREVAALERRTRALDNEREAVGRSAQEAAKAEAAFRLLEAAKKANLPVTDELKAKVDTLATAYAAAKVRLDEAEAAQRRVEEAQRYLGDAMTDAVTDLALEGRSLSEVLDGLAKSLAKAAIQALLIGKGPLGGMFGGAAPTGGGLGGLLGSLLGFSEGGHVRGPGTSTSDSIPAKLSDGEFVVNAKATADNRELLERINRGEPAPAAAELPLPDRPETLDKTTLRFLKAIMGEAPAEAPQLPAYATGGHVRGPGTGTSDSITARLSAGEFVVRASAAARHRELLETINSGQDVRLPAFAKGGVVGGTAPSIPKASLGQAPGRAAGSVITVAPSITVQATGGTPEQNADLAGQVGQQVGQQLDAMVRGIMNDELRRQARPGGLFDHMRR